MKGTALSNVAPDYEKLTNGTKECNRCGEPKPLNEFRKNGRGAEKRHGICLECEALARLGHRAQKIDAAQVKTIHQCCRCSEPITNRQSYGVGALGYYHMVGCEFPVPRTDSHKRKLPRAKGEFNRIIAPKRAEYLPVKD